MITLAYPWLLALLPLPLLLLKLLPVYRVGKSSVRIPRLNRLAELTGQTPEQGAVVMKRTWLATTCLVSVWVAAMLAVAKPQFVGDPIVNSLPSRDMLLAIDLSGSMSAKDFTDADGNQVDRLTACKQVLAEFLSRREGDRVGLIFFGSAAFVQAPFTEDLELCQTLLDEAQVGMAGPQTVVGDAVGLALTVFERSEQEDRVLIVLTDGNDTGSKVTPLEAARIGKDQGVTIHTIAIGDPASVGEEAIDEKVLQDMADVTGGGFYRASDRDQLEEIYGQLDAIETRELETESYRPKTDLFYWPLAAFLCLGLLYHGTCMIRHLMGKRQADSKLAAQVSTTVAATMLVVLCAGVSDATATSGPTGFHFIRPWWWIALVPIVVILVAIFRWQDSIRGLQVAIAPHLLKHLRVQPETEKRFRPVHLLAVAWGIACLGLVGPTWQREPSPFASDQAALVIVQEVSPTMLAQDIQPSRMQRSAHKVRDLLALRPGTKTALVAYYGSAHLVMPMTGDAEIIESFVGELSPEIMPSEGDSIADAIRLANEQLRSANQPGSILVITDGVDVVQNKRLSEIRGAPVHFLAMAGDQSKPLPIESPPAPSLDLPALKASARAANASLVVVTPDEEDVTKLSREITTQFVAAGAEDGGQRWKDVGYWLTPLLAIISLFWFRPGWMVNWE